MGCEKIINLQQEGGENILNLEREMNVGGAVKSVNGMTGDVVLTTSDLENTSDYQTGSEVESAISTAVGAEATLRENADIALGGRIDNLVTGLGNEITARQTADNSLQGQIDAITASSDVTDIVGTKAELNNYDTSKLGNNDIIKVLQDESQNDETTYYRWSTTTNSFTLIGEEGPYYTKAQTNELLNAKQNTLTAGANITITNNVISATDTTYTAGNAITIDANNEISADIYPADYFTAEASMTEIGSEVSFDDTIPASMSFDNLYGDSTQQTYTGKNKWYYTDGSSTSSGITWVRSGATVTGNGTASSTSSQMWSLFTLPSILPAGTYTASIDAPVSHRIEFVIQDSGGNNHFDFKIPAGETSFTYTTSYDIAKVRGGAGGWSVDDEINITIQNMQFEAGSTPTSYEPYVGGIESPNPNGYPQLVNSVTGTQTVTLSDDNNQTNTYTVNLGSVELCKIGDYQDYIYKSGDDWYVHKEVGKYTFDGTEIWSDGAYGVNSWYLRDILEFPYDASKVQIISNLFRGISNNDRNTGGDNTIYTSAVNSFWVRNTLLSTLAQVQAATNGNYVYYALATPTDTKITDSSLINQLDTLDTAHSYDGETNIVISAIGTNLPAIAKITAIRNSASGIVKVLENAVTSAELDSRLGGLTLLPISQTDYDNLQDKDPNTLYVITGA